MRANYKKGLFRLWLVISIIWYISIGFITANSIVSYVTYYGDLYSTLEPEEHFFEKIQRQKFLVTACQHAIDVACTKPGGSVLDTIFDGYKREQCNQQIMLNLLQEKLKQLDQTITVKKSEPCFDLVKFPPPEIDWLPVIFFLFAPLLPILLCIVARFILKGFYPGQTE